MREDGDNPKIDNNSNIIKDFQKNITNLIDCKQKFQKYYNKTKIILDETLKLFYNTFIIQKIKS